MAESRGRGGAVEWKSPIVAGEFADDWKLLYLHTPDDLAILGRAMGHCSGTHFVWACEERIWYFFALVDGKGVPHGTLHTKEEKWLGKAHPRDALPRIPFQPLRNDQYGGYPTYQEFVLGAKAAKLKYEPGKWCAYQFNSQSYENGMHDPYYEGGWQYYNPMPQRPDGVPDGMYQEFVRCWKAMEDHWNKEHGHVKISGRTFYYDGKKQVVLSFSGGGQGKATPTQRRMIFDWLNSLQKKGLAPTVALV